MRTEERIKSKYPSTWEIKFFEKDGDKYATFVLELQTDIMLESKFWPKIKPLLIAGKLDNIANFKQKAKRKNSFVFALNFKNKKIMKQIEKISAITNNTMYSTNYGPLINYEVGIATTDEKINFSVKFYLGKMNDSLLQKSFYRDHRAENHYIREVILNIHLRMDETNYNCKNFQELDDFICQRLSEFHDYFQHDLLLESLKKVDASLFKPKKIEKKDEYTEKKRDKISGKALTQSGMHKKSPPKPIKISNPFDELENLDSPSSPTKETGTTSSTPSTLGSTS